MNHIRGQLISHFLIAGIFLAGCMARVEANAVAPEMTGRWKGDTKIVVTWVKQEKLTVDIQIDADGTVRGTVGDARLVDARFQKNRETIGKKLNLATDYIIKGRLEGPVIKAEHIRRKRVFIPMNFKDGQLKGGVATSGLKFGRKKTGILSTTSLVLKRQK